MHCADLRQWASADHTFDSVADGRVIAVVYGMSIALTSPTITGDPWQHGIP
jgi:hypothetical protein